MRLVSFFAVALLSLSCGRLHADGPGFSLKSSDRVVLLGGGFIEQERHHARLETMLVSRHPEADIIVRNLGWGGDTVRGLARTSGYQNPDGLARLLKEVQEFKPTVVFLGFGMNESFDGPKGLPAFIDDYNQLLARLAPLKARMVILSPTFHEDLGRPLPDPSEHNLGLEEYTAALGKLAAKRSADFVDLFHTLQKAAQRENAPRLTTNGILLTDAGYALAALAMADQLGLAAMPWRVELHADGKVLARRGTIVDKLKVANGTIRFSVLDDALPVKGDTQFLRVADLPADDHVLTIDGAAVARRSAAEWHKGIDIQSGAAFVDADKLRVAIVYKAELFYRRWRPFNDHSRHWDFMKGDFGLYDKDIAEQERVIAQLRRPRPHVFEISAVAK